MSFRILMTGATGYLGRALCLRMPGVREIVALVRPGARRRVVDGVRSVELDVFDVAQLAAAMQAGDTVVHLIGTPHPNPRKAAEFQRVDLASVRACAAAAARAGAAHFIYVSVAQPAPVMREYVEARRAGEAAIVAAGLTATILRPWYVLGPGHRWPYLLLPLYGIAKLLPGPRAPARRLGLVTLAQMTSALLRAAEHPPPRGTRRILEVPQIRAA
jgi:nucleoside-diphosphate-sugar epimerase